MADAIQWSIPLGNGAVNLHYNEVVYSWFNGSVFVNNYNYEIMLILNPRRITSFIFTREAYDSTLSSNIAIYSAILPNGQEHIVSLNNGNNHYYTYLNNNSVGFLLK